MKRTRFTDEQMTGFRRDHETCFEPADFSRYYSACKA